MKLQKLAGRATVISSVDSGDWQDCGYLELKYMVSPLMNISLVKKKKENQ